MSETTRSGDATRRALLETGERRLALLLDHAPRLMAERDPAALLRHVAAAARDITEARIAGVGIMSDDGSRFPDLVSVGLDEALDEHGEPARVVGVLADITVDSKHGHGAAFTVYLPADSALERAGHSVVEAANAEEGETLFEAMGDVDLLVSDVVLPGRSGFELFHRLHAKVPSLRVLFISGYTDYAMFDETIVERDLAFLEKPF